MSRTCSKCSGSMTKNEDARIGIPQWFLPTDSHGFAMHNAEPVIRERRIPASFYSCDSCEHCETVDGKETL